VGADRGAQRALVGLPLPLGREVDDLRRNRSLFAGEPIPFRVAHPRRTVAVADIASLPLPLQPDATAPRCTVGSRSRPCVS
jgi:hypothetical protein